MDDEINCTYREENFLVSFSFHVEYCCVGKWGAKEGFYGKFHEVLGEDHEEQVPSGEGAKEGYEYKWYCVKDVADD